MEIPLVALGGVDFVGYEDFSFLKFTESMLFQMYLTTHVILHSYP